MTNRTLALLTALLLTAPAGWLHAQEEEDEKAPTPPEPFPTAYQDSEILPKSVSPDGRYGLIYPKRELSAEAEHPQLLLAELKPFRVLMEISRDTYLEHGHNSYEIEWAKDGSAVLIDAEIKWGPDKVFLVPIRNGQAGPIVGLLAEIKKMIRPDYQASKATPFNDQLEFIFDASYYLGPKGKKKEVMQQWSLATPGQVNILCFCTTDPKDMDEHSWSARFTGTWNVAKASFTEHKIERLPSGPKASPAEE